MRYSAPTVDGFCVKNNIEHYYFFKTTTNNNDDPLTMLNDNDNDNNKPICLPSYFFTNISKHLENIPIQDKKI
jgi:hypothetical protein